MKKQIVLLAVAFSFTPLAALAASPAHLSCSKERQQIAGFNAVVARSCPPASLASSKTCRKLWALVRGEK